MKNVGLSMIGGGFMGKLHTLAIQSYPVYYYPPAVNVFKECENSSFVFNFSIIYNEFLSLMTWVAVILSHLDSTDLFIFSPEPFIRCSFSPFIFNKLASCASNEK